MIFPPIKLINPIGANEQPQLSQSASNDTLVTGMATSSIYALIALLGRAYERHT